MKKFRLNRPLRPRSPRFVDVAVDHGLFNERRFHNGTENFERGIKTLVSASSAGMIDTGL